MALNDIKLSDDFDISFANGDIESLQNAKSVAQDLRVALFKELFIAINNDSISIKEIENIITNVALNDQRIDYESIIVQVLSNNNKLSFIIIFSTVDSEELESLSFSEEDIING